MKAGQIDVVAGPVTITAARAGDMRFSQPYFQSSLGILSRSKAPGWWGRIAPFFSPEFYWALTVFLSVLFAVGTLIWLVERRGVERHFPAAPMAGIGSGVWFAIVTKSTVGYGDLSP